MPTVLLFNSGFLNIVSLVFAIIGIILTVKSKKSKKPYYSSRSSRIIGKEVNSIDGLRVFYGDKQLSALTITKFAFWNSGRDTISYSDLSEKDKLRIESKNGVEILSCEVLTQSKDAFAFNTQIEGDGKTILLNFDYVDFRGGAILRIRHTGSSFKDLELKGSIKTVDSVDRKTVYPPPFDIFSSNNSFLNILWLCLLFIIGVFLLYFGVVELINPELLQRFSLIEFSDINTYRIIGYVICPILVASGAMYIIFFFKKVRPSLPKKLNDVFWDDDF